MNGRERAWMCAHCGYVSDAFTAVTLEDTRPEEGDLSLCLNCGARYIRESDRWRPLSTAEYGALSESDKRRLWEAEQVRQLAMVGGRA